MDITPKLFTDSLELMSAYIKYMWANEDLDAIPRMLNLFNESIFDTEDISKNQLRQLAVYATDMIYRFAAELEERDVYTEVYFKKVVAHLMKLLHGSGIEVFYILDNEMSEDRYELTVDFYRLSGAAVVTPYDGNRIRKYGEVEGMIKNCMAHGKSIVYIEKDASVDYMEKIIRVATESKYIGVFRNYAPPSKHILVL